MSGSIIMYVIRVLQCIAIFLLVVQKKQDQDKSKKGGLDASDGAMDTMPKGKAGSRPPGFPASSHPQQASPPLSQQPLLPPPANLPFRDPAILGIHLFTIICIIMRY